MARVVAIALALLALGCNVILDNQKRSLDVPSLIVDGSVVDDSSLPGFGDAGPPPSCGRGGRLPECAPGLTQDRDEVCGLCQEGKRSRTRTCTQDCVWSAWSAWSECVESTELCTPGARMEMTERCGACEAGTRTATRTCTSECGWSDWSYGACTLDADRCEPGAVQTLPSVSCDSMCGKATQTRSCNAECRWAAPAMGVCAGQGVCVPETTRMMVGNCNANYCNKGVQDQRQTCTQECTWSEPVGFGACTIPTEICRPPDLGGVGWRCRQNDPGFRETCRPASASEAERCTWAGNREAYQDC